MEKTSFETTLDIIEQSNNKLQQAKRNPTDLRQVQVLEVIAETLLAMLVHIAYDSETKGKR